MAYSMKTLWAKFNRKEFSQLVKTVPLLYKKHRNPDLLKILGLSYDQLVANSRISERKIRIQKLAIKAFVELGQYDKFESYKGLGLVYLHQDKLQKSLVYFKKANSISRKNPTVYIDLGNVYRAMGKTNMAIVWYKKAYKTKLTRAVAKINLEGI